MTAEPELTRIDIAQRNQILQIDGLSPDPADKAAQAMRTHCSQRFTERWLPGPSGGHRHGSAGSEGHPRRGAAGDRRAEAGSRLGDPISAGSGGGRFSGASWADYPLEGNSRSHGSRLPEARSGDGYPPAGTARADAGGGSHTAAHPGRSQ
jgi:hypothetical protein